MTQKLRTPLAVPALLAAPLVALAAYAGPPQAEMTKTEAQAIALKAAPGEVIEAEYETENGAWRYSFDIRQGDRIHEIGVDPQTGAIVENAFENEADEADDVEDEGDDGVEPEDGEG